MWSYIFDTILEWTLYAAVYGIYILGSRILHLFGKPLPSASYADCLGASEAFDLFFTLNTAVGLAFISAIGLSIFGLTQLLG